MKQPKPNGPNHIRINRYTLLAAIAWTVFVAAVLSWNIYNHLIEVPVESLWTVANAELKKTAPGYFFLWTLGLLGIFVASCHVKHRLVQYEKSEEKRRISNARYRALYESSQDAIMILAPPSWKFSEGNPSAIELFGAENEAKFITKSPWEVSPEYQPDGQRSNEKAPKVIEKAMQEGSHFFEWTHKTITGKEFPATVLLTRVEFEQGKPLLQATVRDITENKQAEEEVRKSSEQLKAILENVRIGISLINPEMEILSLNNQMREWFPDADISNKPICYKTFNSPPRDSICTYCPTCKTLKDGLIHEAVTDTPTGDEVRNYRVISSPIFDEDQNVTAAIEMVDDITEYSRIQKKLSEAKEEFETIFENSYVGIMYLKGGRYFARGNKRLAEILGYNDSEEMVGMDVRALHLNEERYSEFGEKYYSKLGNGELFQVDYQLRRKDGSSVWCTLSGKALDQSNLERGVIWVIDDIEPRKKAERYLIEAKEHAGREKAKLSAMIAGMEEGIVFADADNFIVEVNEFFCNFMNTPRETIIGSRIEDFHHGEVLSRVEKTIQNFRQHPHSEPFTCRRSMGQAELFLRMQPIYSNEQYQGVLLNVIDVTEMAKAQQKAEEASRSKSEFLANMSHEIRTPLNAIIGFSDLLANEKLTDEQMESVNTVRESGKHLLQLIDDILDLSKIEAGRLELEIMDCSLSEILDNLRSMSRHKAEEKNLEFEINKSSDLPVQIRTDPTRLCQCLINLVSNALKFTEQGHVHVNVLSANIDDQSHVVFEVEDTGIGIPAEKQEQIFESFTQADGSTSRKYGGTGLGLAITRQLAKLLGGELAVTSAEGEGSVFSIRIPVGNNVPGSPSLDSECESEQSGVEEDKEEEQQGTSLSGHVLVVDDVPTNQALTKALLSRMGLEVTVAEDGIQAVQQVLSGSFDLILMDIQMPRMNGYDATSTLRDKGIKTPIVALTASVMKGDEQKCYEAGCDDYLTKPIDSEKLSKIARKYLTVDEDVLVRS